MSQTGLAIVECRWWDQGNDSVRPLFETLAGIVEGNPHDVRYDMFADRSSLEKIMSEISKSGSFHSIYIASHGNEQELGALGDARISRTELRNSIRNTNSSAHIRGIYFGSCLVANESNARFLLEDGATKLQWVAGYSEVVDWVDSSAVDMVFWSKYLHERKVNRHRRGRGKKLSEIELVQVASRKMKDLIPNIFTQMKFNIYYIGSGGNLNSIW